MFPSHSFGCALVGAALVVLVLARPPASQAEESDVHLRAPMVATPTQTCGLHSLYVCAKVGGHPFGSVRELHQAAAPLDSRGTKASDLVKWGREYGLPVEAVRTDLETLKRWDLPAVLHVNSSHYIALVGQENGRFVVFDNNIGLFDCSPAWFHQKYR